MKNIKRIFTLVVAFLCLFMLAGCNNEDGVKKCIVADDNTTVAVAALPFAVEDKTIIGLFNPKTKVMYTNNYSETLPQAEYEVIYAHVNSTIYPSVKVKGANFGGWLFTDTEGKTTRVTNIDPSHQTLEAKVMTFGEAGLVALVCISIVFGMLGLICGVLYLFKFIAPKQDVKQTQEPVKKPVVQQRQALKFEDIKDDDMMAAALVATIDYHEETGKDVRLVSIKEVR